ncbi:MAG: phosphoribosylglycinamide formyltransferase [Myxococcota bacterium]
MSLRIAVLISGAGTTLQSLIDHRERGVLPVELAAVVSSKPGAAGLERARKAGIPAHGLDRRAFRDESAFNDALHAILEPIAPDLVVLAGFLSRFELRGRFEGRAINTHPALIPAFCGPGFYGMRVHRAVLEKGVRVSGATVHYCDEEYDNGPIILQRAVPVLQSDTPESLAERVQAAERELLPEAIVLHAEGRLRIEGRRVRILPPPAREGSASDQARPAGPGKTGLT